MAFVVHTLVSAAILFLAGRIVAGIEVRSARAAVLGALALGVVNWFVWTLLWPITLPLAFVTLGVFALAANAVALKIAASLVRGFEVAGFGAALNGAVVLWICNLIAGMLFR